MTHINIPLAVRVDLSLISDVGVDNENDKPSSAHRVPSLSPGLTAPSDRNKPSIPPLPPHIKRKKGCRLADRQALKHAHLHVEGLKCPWDGIIPARMTPRRTTLPRTEIGKGGPAA